MKYQYIKCFLDGYNELNSGNITAFEIESDIKTMLPKGSISYRDSGGLEFSRFWGLAIGSTVDIVLSTDEDEAGKTNEYEYPTFYVTSVENACENDVSLASGTIVIKFGHPWFVFKDATNHAYKPMRMNDLIKAVLTDKSRGCEEFKIAADKFFLKTDDDGSISKYKVAESDLDFIRTKVIPYCSIQQQPAHLFCRENGEFLLSTFRKLFSQKPSIVFGPTQEYFGDEIVAETLQTVKDNFSITDDMIFSIGGLQFKIGHKDQIEEFKPRFVTEVVNNGSILAGGKMPGNLLKKETGDFFGNLMPFATAFAMRTKATTTKILQNRSLLDIMTLFFNSSKVLDEMFTIAVETDSIVGTAYVGDTAQFILPAFKYGDEEVKPKGNYVHWSAGKWLITKTKHEIDPDDQNRLLTKTYMSRPCFIGSKKTTSIVNPDFLYSVPS
jgi:hypothetical protein